MSPLEALVRLQKRMETRGDAPPPGWIKAPFGICVTFDQVGTYVDARILEDASSGKSRPVRHLVPGLVEARTVAIVANVGWDKASYALGIGDVPKRLAQHAEFVRRNRDFVVGATDPALIAFDAFLERWEPEGPAAQSVSALVSDRGLDANVMFELDGVGFVHEAGEFIDLVAGEIADEEDAVTGVCLVTEDVGPIARIHPSFKRLTRGQSSGGSIASFNAPAWSYTGMTQGENASTGADAARRYGSALNALFDGTTNRLRSPVGGMDVVFWADADGEGARGAEALFRATFEGVEDDAAEDQRLAAAINAMAAGRVVTPGDIGLAEDAAFSVLGVSGNGGRLSVRLWQSGRIGGVLGRMSEHARDVAIEPAPWRRLPSLSWLVMMACVPEGIRSSNGGGTDWKKCREHLDQHAHGVAEGMARAILTGAPYPAQFLAAILRRLRANDTPTGWHAAGVRAVLSRSHRLGFRGVDVPMALDQTRAEPGYVAGRLFAMCEEAQRMANPGINATIRDRFFSSAMTTPGITIPVLVRRGQAHLAKIRKWPSGRDLDVSIAALVGGMGSSWPRSLNSEQQGEFLLGYYHERSGFDLAAKARREAAAAKGIGHMDQDLEIEGENEDER